MFFHHNHTMENNRIGVKYDIENHASMYSPNKEVLKSTTKGYNGLTALNKRLTKEFEQFGARVNILANISNGKSRMDRPFALAAASLNK